MSKEQTEEMSVDLAMCHTEFATGVGEIYTDYDATAQKMFAKGYRKQSEGTWIWTENGEVDYEKYWVCSVCKEHDFVRTKYCPNCGAKMHKQTEIKNYPPYLDRPKMKGGMSDDE